MKKRILGNTGLEVSILSYGSSALGGVFGDITEKEGINTVHRALDMGVNLVDSSPYYGLTKAETLLGKALATVPRESYVLTTKVGRYGDEEFDFSAERVTKSVDESLKRLQLNHVDVIQCHDIEFGDRNQIIHETIPALRRVVESGKARFVGVTGLPLKIFTEVASQVPIDTIISYCRYGLNDTSLETILPFLNEKGIGVMAAAPLGMGLLTEKGPSPWHPAPDAVKEACARAAQWCQSRGISIEKLAVQFVVSNPQIATTLVGTADPAQIENNIKWAQEPVDEELVAGVQAILAPVRNQTWNMGRPENNDEQAL